MTQDGKISKKSWKIDEDARLLQLVSEYGLNGHWTTISAKIGNRSGKQCRERYHNHLKPDICKDAWTQEEDDLLNDSQKLMGNQWAKIAKLLPGRSDNSVKNRWHIINRNKLNEPQLANAVVTNPVARPQIPKLSLNMLRSAAPVQNITPLVEQDLLSFYYSHDSHEHYHRSDSSRAGTGRNDMEFCPGSGRRDMSMTESAPELEGDEFDQFEAFIDRAMKEDNKPNNSIVSFNNTMSSLVSDVTMEATFVDCDELDCCEYEDEIGDQVWESTLCHFRCASAVEMCDNTTVDASIDRFSEPALSFREMDSVLDDLGNDCDEDDSLAMFDDLMDSSTCANTLQNASPFRKHCVQDLTRFVSYLQYKLSPRTTPRSPLCPPNLNSKKQRAGRTPRSPYQLVNSMLGRQ